MGAYRDENKNGTWYCKFSYVNWKGEKLYKKKRGFSTYNHGVSKSTILQRRADNRRYNFL